MSITFKDLIFNYLKKQEDAPANAVGDGGGVALPPKHEPGVKKKDDKKDPLMYAKPLKRKIEEEDDNNNVVLKKVIEDIDKVVQKSRETYQDAVQFEPEDKKKSFKERFGLGTFGYSIGPVDALKPMASLGDTPPKTRGQKRHITSSKDIQTKEKEKNEKIKMSKAGTLPFTTDDSMLIYNKRGK